MVANNNTKTSFPRSRYPQRRAVHQRYGRPLYSKYSKPFEGEPQNSAIREEHPLFDRLYSAEVLMASWQQIRKGRSVATRQRRGGADRVSLEMFERQLEPNLRRLSNELRNGYYRPGPLNQFHLPKPGGGTRVLTVLTIRDRIVQRAALNLMSPIWEPDFLNCSHAFRPDTSVQTALRQVEQYYEQGYRWAVDADIENFFDRVQLDRLIALLRAKIKDRRMLALLELWLEHTSEPAVSHDSSNPSDNKPRSSRASESMPEKVAEEENKPNSKRNGGFQKRLADTLEWGMHNLGGSHEYSYSGRQSRTESSSRWNRSSFADFEIDEELDWDVSSPANGNSLSGANSSAPFDQAILRRFGLDGALLGMSVARRALKQGLKLPHLPAGLSNFTKTGIALAVVGGVGVWVVRHWRKLPTLYEVETANYQREMASSSSPFKVTNNLSRIGERVGLAQGSILSPLYSNIFLHEFDKELTAKNYKLVRFADDMLILCKSQNEAFQARQVAETILLRMGLNFKPSKTRVAPLAEGFKFLGSEFDVRGHWKQFSINPKSVDPTGQTSIGWKQESMGWLSRTARLKPGIIQRGKRKQ